MVDQRRFDNQPTDFIDAKTAAKRLGVEVRTLYAYASRGLVRSVRGARGLQRMYAVADLERLKARSGARAGHGAVAAGALRWGEPVLDSAITQITPSGPAYRGRLATELAAARVRFENVAELLWSGYLPAAPIVWPRPTLPLAQLGRLIPSDALPLEVMAVLVPLAGLADPHRGDGRPDAIVARCRLLVPLLAAALGWGVNGDAAHVTRALGAPSVAAIAARALGLDDDAAPILETILIVLADHELNASSFAARIAASTDADPYACFAAALAALSGPRHGSAAEALVHYADELGSPERAVKIVRELRARGEAPPGFGHPLYPTGDPRARPLLELAEVVLTSSRGVAQRRARTILAIVDTVADAPTSSSRRASARRAGDPPSATSRRSATDAGATPRSSTRHASAPLLPSVDVGLAAIVAALGLAPAVSTGLFAVARSAGWLAHILEQRAAGFLLRPRARYVGVATTPG